MGIKNTSVSHIILVNGKRLSINHNLHNFLRLFEAWSTVSRATGKITISDPII
jgi:hypothetical protein